MDAAKLIIEVTGDDTPPPEGVLEAPRPQERPAPSRVEPIPEPPRHPAPVRPTIPEPAAYKGPAPSVPIDEQKKTILEAKGAKKFGFTPAILDKMSPDALEGLYQQLAPRPTAKEQAPKPTPPPSAPDVKPIPPAGGPEAPDWAPRFRELQNRFDLGNKLSEAELDELKKLNEKLKVLAAGESKRPQPGKASDAVPKSESKMGRPDEPDEIRFHPVRPVHPVRPIANAHDEVGAPPPTAKSAQAKPPSLPRIDETYSFQGEKPPERKKPPAADDEKTYRFKRPRAEPVRSKVPELPKIPLAGDTYDVLDATKRPEPPKPPPPPGAKPVKPPVAPTAPLIPPAFAKYIPAGIGNAVNAAASMGKTAAAGAGVGGMAAGAAGVGGMAAGAAAVAGPLLVADLAAGAFAKSINKAAANTEKLGTVAAQLAHNDHVGMFNAAVDHVTEGLEEFPIAGKVWASEVRLAVAPIRAFTAAVGAFVARERELASYSGPLSAASAKADVRSMLLDFKEARATEGSGAGLIDAESRVNEEIRNILLPMKEFLINRLASGLENMLAIWDAIKPIFETIENGVLAGRAVLEEILRTIASSSIVPEKIEKAINGFLDGLHKKANAGPSDPPINLWMDAANGLGRDRVPQQGRGRPPLGPIFPGFPLANQ